MCSYFRDGVRVCVDTKTLMKSDGKFTDNYKSTRLRVRMDS